MDGTVVLVLFLVFLFGGMMLALVMGYREIEDQREQEAARAARTVHAARAVVVPAFFAAPDGRAVARPGLTYDDALLSLLEQHVQAEHERVAEFVHFPSMDRLYRESESRLHVH